MYHPNFKTSDFSYSLPHELIAQYPLAERTASRLMYVDLQVKQLAHQQFTDFLAYLKPYDLLIFNNTKVFPARLFGQKLTGGKVECLIERVLSNQSAIVHLRASKAPKEGSVIFFNGVSATIIKKKNDLYELFFQIKENIFDWLQQYGQIPLPPYVERTPEVIDLERYQTVYAEHVGAVAAPTAGLHFDSSIMQKINQQGINTAFLTLHVGAGTFQPVRVEHLEQHVMHSEYMELREDVCMAIQQCRKQGGRVIAVGTTVLRTLETASLSGVTLPYCGETNLFIYPGFDFKCVDGLFTNFHLPQSTLLMLVCAFGGYEKMMQAYKEAVLQKYRFFSYGDAMFIVR